MVFRDMAKKHFMEALKFDPDHVESQRSIRKLKKMETLKVEGKYFQQRTN